MRRYTGLWLALTGLVLFAGGAHAGPMAADSVTAILGAGAYSYTTHDPDQAEGAAEIAANAGRLSITCQNQGTEPALIRAGAATGGSTGVVIGGGASALDGTGGVHTLRTTAGIWIYDVNNNGNADVVCIEKLAP